MPDKAAESNPFLSGLIALQNEKGTEVWPENWPSFELFCRVRTQWRVGFNGPTGLDYSALYPLLDRVATDAGEWEHLLDDVQTLEASALEAMTEKSD